MQRILSVETSRNSNTTSEFVTKRLCCSFILIVAFFAVICGFFLGRFASNRTLEKMKIEVTDVSKKLMTLDKRLRQSFQDDLSSANCSLFNSIIQCEHLKIVRDTSIKSTQELLDVLNDCFHYG